MDETLIQFWTILGPIGILFFFAIREFFCYLKAKKTNGNTQSDLLDKVKLIESNHLKDILKAISEGNDRVVEAINENGKQQIQILGEIKGALSQMK